jgi:hypothetical protein
VSAQLTTEAAQRLRELAAEDDRSVSAEIRTAVRIYLRERAAAHARNHEEER